MFTPSQKPLIITYEIAENRTAQLSPKDLAVVASRAVDAGATIIHPRFSTLDAGFVEETLTLIKTKNPEVILEVDSSILPYEGDVSISMYSIKNFRDLESCLPHGVPFEFQAHSRETLNGLVALKKKGVLKGPLRLLLVPGIAGSEIAWVRNLASMVSALPPGIQWSVSATSVAEEHSPSTLATLALLIGGHVRVGLEDAAYFRKGGLANSSITSVEKLAGLSRELGRSISSFRETQETLGLVSKRSLTLELLKSLAESVAI